MTLGGGAVGLRGGRARWPAAGAARSSRALLIAATALVLVMACQRRTPESAMPTVPTAPAPVTTSVTPSARRFATQPQTQPYPAEVDATLAAATAALPKGYRPRTRHHGGKEHPGSGPHPDPYAPAGASPNFTNRLLLETSPYLRQHAHNPVDWRPWGSEAFAEARRLKRPIFLSVGYATCHWCHVMEHESFEDLAIAALINARYVPIKLDREERPDVDAIYMAAVQAMSGNGGWPMSVWIAPGPGGAGQELAGLPFFAGTYFPPRGGMRGRPGFEGLLTQFADQYQEDEAGVVAQGRRVAAHIAAQMATSQRGDVVGVDAVDRLAAQLHGQFDAVHGGTQRAPKFPSNIPVGLLLRHAARAGAPQSRHVALFSLAKMSMGGIYDHVGGGFARYSTDARWLVPHFEKMLYDQALIGGALVDALQASGDARYATTLRETMDYLLREMQAPGGAFYSATDADSEGEEGRFFVWTPAQLREVLGEADATLVAEVYDVSERGNFEGNNVLHLARSLEEEAKARGVAAEAFTARLRAARDKLYTARAKRVPPLLDDKIIASWNGLLIATLARAGAAIPEPRYLEAAGRAADFVLAKMADGQGGLRRIAHGEQAHIEGMLDDYAFMIQGLLALFEATGAPRWLERALALQAAQNAGFADSAGGYFMTAATASPLLAREKPDYDGAEPSGNSIAAQNLLRLAALTGEEAYLERARAALAAFGQRLARSPMALTEMLVAVELLHAPLKQLVLVRPAGSAATAFAPMFGALRGVAPVNHVVIAVEHGAGQAALDALTPLTREKVARDGKVTAYVCVRGICKLPTTDPALMVAQLREP